MALNINGTTGISGVDGSVSAPVLAGTDSNTGISFGSDIVNINTGGTRRINVNSSGQVGIGCDAGVTLDVQSAGGSAGWQMRVKNVGGSNDSGFFRDANDHFECVLRNGAGGLSFIKNSGGASSASLEFTTQGAERMRINDNGGVNIGGGLSSTYNLTGPGATFSAAVVGGTSGFNGLSLVKNQSNWGTALYINRNGVGDGVLIEFAESNTTEGHISVSGGSVSYNGGVLTRWSQIKGLSTTDKSARPTIYQGTVMSNLDDLCEWKDEENQQLNMTKISDVEGDKDVAGIFWDWDNSDETYVNDFYVAMTGDMVIRVAASTTVARGDLLVSAGDGTAKPQADDIVRSSTIAKIISTNHTATYADGSKAYPCVLMAC